MALRERDGSWNHPGPGVLNTTSEWHQSCPPGPRYQPSKSAGSTKEHQLSESDVSEAAGRMGGTTGTLYKLYIYESMRPF
jgi:hypothetical protein